MTKRSLHWRLAIMMVTALILDFIFPSQDGVVTASLIGALITGAGVQTTFAGQSQMDNYVVIGDVDTTNPLQGLTVEVDGTPFINIANSAVLVSAFFKWQMEIVGSIVGLMFKLGTGSIKRNTTYRFTNAGATTPNIFVFSDAPNGVPFIATTKQINISSFEDFNKFSALFATVPANITNIEIVFNNGWRATISAIEAAGLFSLFNEAETDGYLAGALVIDNTNQSISSVRIFAGGTAVTVLIAKVPDAAFQALLAQ